MEINRIYNMDCLELMKKIPDNSIACVITDPVYSLPNNNFRPEARINQRTFGDFSTGIYFFKEFVKECKRILKEDGDLIIFCDEVFYAVLYPLLYENFYANKMVVWNKERIGMGGIWRRQFEIFIHSYLKPKKEKSGDGDIVNCKPVSPKEKLHTSQKPVELLKKIILKTSKEGDTIFDGFFGSGTTGVACKETGRNYIGSEISEDFYKIANKRLNPEQQKLASKLSKTKEAKE